MKILAQVTACYLPIMFDYENPEIPSVMPTLLFIYYILFTSYFIYIEDRKLGKRFLTWLYIYIIKLIKSLILHLV